MGCNPTTVLLNEIERRAKTEEYRTIPIEAHEDKPLGPLIAPHLRTVLYDLDRMAGAGDKVKRGLAVLRSFIGTLKVTVGEVTFGLDIDPEKGAADSGDLEIDLPNLFVAVAKAAEERKSAVAVLIDEIQYFNQKELGALIMAMHKVQQRQLPLVLLGAGLPIPSRAGGGIEVLCEAVIHFPGHWRAFEGRHRQSPPRPGTSGGSRFRCPGADRSVSPDEGISVFSSGVGLSGVEPRGGQSDHTAHRSKRHGKGYPAPRPEFLPSALRPPHTQ